MVKSELVVNTDKVVVEEEEGDLWEEDDIDADGEFEFEARGEEETSAVCEEVSEP